MLAGNNGAAPKEDAAPQKAAAEVVENDRPATATDETPAVEADATPAAETDEAPAAETDEAPAAEADSAADAEEPVAESSTDKTDAEEAGALAAAAKSA